MKIRERALTLLLSLVMVLTLMPAMAFADDEAAAGESQPVVVQNEQARETARENADAAIARAEANAKGALPEESRLELSDGEHQTRKVAKLEYKGSNEYRQAYVDEDGELMEPYFSGYWEEGNEVIVTWDNGDVDRYVCKKYRDKNYKYEYDDEYDIDYFLNGDDPEYETDPEGYTSITNTEYFESTVDADGKITLSYNYLYEYEVPEEDGSYWDSEWVDATTTFQGRCVKELVYDGPAVYYYEEEGPDGAQVYQEGAKIKIVYSDGEVVTTECKKYGKEDEYWDFFYEGEEPIVVSRTTSDGYTYEDATNAIYFDFDWDNITADSLPIRYEGASGVIPIQVKKLAKPTKVEFTAPDTYKAIGLIGSKSVGMYGSGLKFHFTFDDGTEKEYTYGKTSEGWYTFTNTEDPDDMFWPTVTFTKRIKKGTHTMSGKLYYEVNDGGGHWEGYNLPISVKVKATQYYAYVVNKTYTYTGKKITPSVVVKYWTGSKFKTMPKTWYTCKPKKYSKWGWYDFKVTIKKAYRKKYGPSLWGNYNIAPKKPTITKATAGNGTITVTWKKFTAAEQKKITKFYVGVSTTKDFRRFSIWSAKKSAGSLKIDGGLKSGTKYYVRVYAIKVSNGEDYWSNPSTTKIVTVK